MGDLSILQNTCRLPNAGQTAQAKAAVSFGEFGEIKNNLAAQAAQTTRITESKGFTDRTTSFETYKAAIYSMLSGLSQNSFGEGGFFVEIPDECLLAMKNDKAYETWVLDTIQKSYASSFLSGYDTYTFLKFGATKKECTQECYTFPDRKTRERLRKLIREQKEALKRKRKKLLEKKLLAEKWQKQAYQTAYVQLKIQDHQMQIQEENAAVLQGKDFHRADHSSSIQAAAKRKAGAYESTFLYKGRTPGSFF